MATINMPMRIEKARELAEQHDLGEDVTKALVEAEQLGYSVVDYQLEYGADGSSTLAIGRHEGVMISLTVPFNLGEAYALPGGNPINDFHITVLYLGDLEELTVAQQQQLIGIVTEVARDWKCLEGTLNGLGIFEGEDEDAVYIAAQITSLPELRSVLKGRLDAAEIPYRDDFEFYQPHMTIGSIPKDLTDEQRESILDIPVTSSTVRFSKLTAAIGGAHYNAAFFQDGFYYDGDTSPGSTGDGWLNNSPSAYRPGIFKSLEINKAEQFTLGAWYVPDMVDAHGDWVEKNDLEKTFHDYMADSDRDLRLQHNPEIVAGRIVEGYIQRTALEVDVPDPDTGVLMKHSYPAGTPFLGVIWKDWAWPLVEAGEIRGYSIGGTAEKVSVDLGPDAAAASAA
jgi:2'-5' RNA ligase